ncbi:PAS domain-containing protein [Salegentibacter sp. JZCK2]|uniref:sensor histidine kinase n=1 Tax=Salegentibacter tibetensis TaxID=2873600 RepID=UPI001CCDA4E8|nr:PAS domain-containing protein [Salegentibacter tibetensis]MBZ9728671.1 PAS domain-containing protein [Salegentibacter tibetensis]
MSDTPKKDARQLRELDFDLANYFSNTIIPQLFVDADLILRIFTPPAMKQFSLTYDHVGENISDIKDNLRYPYVVEDIQEVINNKNKILEKEVQTTDGHWFQMNIVPYVEYEEDVTNGVIITFVNITKRLVALRDLEKINSKYQTLRYALAHDIRQPISTITLIADGLSIVHQQQNSNKQAFGEWSNTLKASSKSLETLVEDFAYNKVKEKEKSIAGRLVNIEEICEDIITALKWDIKEKKIKITTDLKVTEITFPRSSLRSVIYNLIHNAVKFSDPKKSSEINITTEEVKGFIILCIQDNGLGISLQHQRGIFKKSSRLSDRIPGTGMGLYVVKKMIEDNEGRIKLESKENEGTTFKVFFKN